MIAHTRQCRGHDPPTWPKRACLSVVSAKIVANNLLLAAKRVGPTGRAMGVDMAEAMRQRAMDGAARCGLTNVDVRAGDATRLPVDDKSVDVVISNGVLNLVPEKERAVAEIARVLKPGGRAQIGDIVIGEVLSEDCLRDIDLWTG